jgi:hypothetical protein
MFLFGWEETKYSIERPRSATTPLIHMPDKSLNFCFFCHMEQMRLKRGFLYDK